MKLIRTALAAALLATACAACTSPSGKTGASDSAAPVADLSDVRLVSYSSCDEMLGGLREHTAKNVGPWGLGGPQLYNMRGDMAMAEQAPAQKAQDSTGQGAPEHSTTNVHEAGVDEPDLVKTDGKRVITVSRGTLRIIDTATRKVTASVKLVTDEQLTWMPGDLLVSGDRALVLLQGGGYDTQGLGKRIAGPGGGPQYVLVDLSGTPKVLGTVKPQGQHVDARLVGTTVRLVVRSQPDITFPQPRDDVPEAERTKVNQATVRQAPIDAWLPKMEIVDASGTARTDAVKCEQVSHPEDYTGTSLLTVHTIDLTAALTGTDPISVAADGDTVYGTGTSLYVASNPRWWFPIPIDPAVIDQPEPTLTKTDPGLAPREEPTPSDPPIPSGDPSQPSLIPTEPKATPTESSSAAVTITPEPVPTPPTPPTAPPVPPEETEVHRFDISQPGAPRYVASGRVPGRLLNQYSLSEHDGHLRVATTLATQKSSSSSVYVLKADTLGKIGEVGGMGKGERIYSVRFIGPVGYVVTFKQVDPLYTLDLSDPAAPRVTGELKITGYSAYLHPAGEGRLIGVGQEASEKGRTLGTQVSLFDVSDPASPKRLSQMFQKDSGSDAEWDPHAFLYWPKTGLSVIPVNSYNPANGSAESGALVLKIDDSGVNRVGMVKHPKQTEGEYAYEPNIRRSMVIGESLWTISDQGLKVNDLDTLADQAWIPLT